MMFDKDLEDAPFEEDMPTVQFKNQMSTVNTNGRHTPLSAFTPLVSFSTTFFSLQNNDAQFQTSLDRELVKHNAELLRKGVIGYLRCCTKETIEDRNAFENGNIFCFQTSEVSDSDSDGALESILAGNQLLNPWRRRRMVEVFSQYADLKGLFKEIKQIFGKGITEEFLYLLDELLQVKLEDLKKMQEGAIDDLVPRMERFWGDENQEKVIKGGWNIYNQLEYQKVNKLAIIDIQNIASSIYFSKKMKYLVLVSIRNQIVTEVNLLDRFVSLAALAASCMILTMMGFSLHDQQLSDFLSELQYKTEDGKLVEDQLAKKVKSQ